MSVSSVPSDEELAVQAQQGSEAGFEQLLRRFQTPVLHFLQHRGAGGDAEDLLQETFLLAYANLARYRPRWRFATWLFTIARRVCISHHRRSKQPENGCEEMASAACGEPGPAEAAADADARRFLWDAAHRVLSPDEATALWLHYGENLPVRDVAAVLERSAVAVKAMIFRSRKKLIPALKELRPDGVAVEPKVERRSNPASGEDARRSALEKDWNYAQASEG
jgi:RNA polymerase sigma-70 factor, ECF subfamily